MQGSSIPEVTRQIHAFFNTGLNKLGKAVGFVKRKDKAKLSGKAFAQALITSCLADGKMTLEQMRDVIQSTGIKISKSGLHQRFNEAAVALLKRCCQEALAKLKAEREGVVGLLSPFSSTEILDSSAVSLPTTMKERYKGLGGGASEAGLKIQTLLDYTDGHIEELTLTQGRENDQSFRGHLAGIKEGALYLQDLGYFCIESLATIHQKKAYFVSRYFAYTALYDTHHQAINLLALLQGAGDVFTGEFMLGKKEKVPIRLIAQRLPDADVEKRVRKIRQRLRKEGREPKKETLELMRWSICITNVPSEMLADNAVYLIYSVRWQIELFFKLCKQEVGIDKIRSKKEPRVLCEIYAKLICVAMLLYLCFPVRWQGLREISYPKAYRYLQHHARAFLKALGSRYRLKNFLSDLWGALQTFAMKDIKRKKPGTHQKLMDTIEGAASA